MNRLLIATLPLLIVTPAFAQESGGGTPGGGRSETRADAEQRAQMIFAQLDANHDGAVTPEERQAARAAGGGQPPQQ